MENTASRVSDAGGAAVDNSWQDDTDDDAHAKKVGEALRTFIQYTQIDEKLL
jgi:hypothetical protein